MSRLLILLLSLCCVSGSALAQGKSGSHGGGPPSSVPAGAVLRPRRRVAGPAAAHRLRWEARAARCQCPFRRRPRPLSAAPHGNNAAGPAGAALGQRASRNSFAGPAVARLGRGLRPGRSRHCQAGRGRQVPVKR